MKQPHEWARAAHILRETFPEAEYPTINDKLARLEHRFTLVSDQATEAAVEMGELLDILAEAGLIEPVISLTILDRLYEQRSYAAT